MGYIGRAFITRDNYPRFKEEIVDLIEIGFQVVFLKVDEEIFYDYESFENHLFLIKKANRFQIKLRKNDNTFELGNQRFDKRKWYCKEDIVNDYDVAQEDAMKIVLKYDEFRESLFKYPLFKDMPGKDFLDLFWIIPIAGLLSLNDVMDYGYVFIVMFLLFVFAKVLRFNRPAYKNMTKKHN
ncbi:hypothetical protein KQ51_01778 [Candidatus Izimaplasma bacterium HR1]|jgi:hypothetical protein|uniref:hypothetical protein n=1 Tax=Candidatus Izimoplasma sp. HR1 TaxID=1541959 RepID=UPI0004F7967F|nr:hypothetical protein KQ51_01778 [Candidatus Izimaplasma bacterium HR1]